MKNEIDLDFFEYIILDNCFKNAAYLSSIVGITEPKYFGNSDVRKIYKLLKMFYEKRERVPTDTELKLYMTHESVSLAFKNVQTTLKQLQDYGEDELIENTELFIKERGFALTLEEIVENYHELDLKNESLAILDKFDKICSLSLNTNLGMEYFKDIDTFIDAIDDETQYISTGIPWLDKKLGGGFREQGKALYVISGATNAGKSIMLGNVAKTAVLAGKNVMVVTLEMSEEIYASRISGQLSRIPIRELGNEKETLRKYCKDFESGNDNRLFIKEYPNNTITVGDIKNYINDLIKRKGFNPDIIVIDYLNLIVSKVVTGNSYTDIKRVTEDLRTLSYIFKAPVVTATQLGRDAFNKENPGIETTSESIGTAQTADVQFAVFSSEDDRAGGILNIGIQKNRYGDNFGTKALSVDWDTLHVEQFEGDDDDEATIENYLNDAESSLRSLEV